MKSFGSALPVGTLALRSARLENILFLNVETVPELANFEDLTLDMKRLWTEASAPLRSEGQSAADVYKRAGERAEFGKVACISAGVLRFREQEKPPFFIVSSYVCDDERDTLTKFSDVLNNFFNGNSSSCFLCGHGIRRNDIPFFARRLLINHVEMPHLFDPNGRHSLAASIIDTSDYWAFSDLTSPRISADLLAHVFGIDTEEGDYDSTIGADLYYAESDMTKLTERSERKLLVATQLMRRFRGEELIADDHVFSKSDL